MEIKIPKEVRAHKETIFFGFTLRQFVCAAVAVGLAVGVYLLAGAFIGKETASWLCILCAAPVALAGFFTYTGMDFRAVRLGRPQIPNSVRWAAERQQRIVKGPFRS